MSTCLASRLPCQPLPFDPLSEPDTCPLLARSAESFRLQLLHEPEAAAIAMVREQKLYLKLKKG